MDQGKAEMLGSEEETATLAKRLGAAWDEIDQLRVREITAKTSQAEAKKSLEITEASFDSNRLAVHQMMLTLETKNVQLRATVAEERRFNQNLVEELSHFAFTTPSSDLLDTRRT